MIEKIIEYYFGNDEQIEKTFLQNTSHRNFFINGKTLKNLYG